MAKTVIGRQNSWQILAELGRGDAGEVLRVQAELSPQMGLMKRPVQNVSGGTILRQAVQIENEAAILEALDGLNLDRKKLHLRTPPLIDRSIPGTEGTVGSFFISVKAPGLAISSLLKQSLQDGIPLSQALALRVLSSTFLLFSKIHAQGILWNDVKMDHIFWDEASSTMTFIDWGNSLFFEPGASAAPLSGGFPDYQQLISEGYKLLHQIAPALLAEVQWPENAQMLDQTELTHLQYRLEYIESQLAMKVIESQLTFKQNLNNLASLEDLRALLELKSTLEKLGVEVDAEALSTGARKLALTYASAKGHASLQELISLIQAGSAPEAARVWSLAEALLNEPELSASAFFTSLLSATLESDWVQAMWMLQKVQVSDKIAPIIQQLIMAMRSLALKTGIDEPLLIDQLRQMNAEACHQLRLKQDSGADENPAATALLSSTEAAGTLIDQWNALASDEMLGDKFLHLRDLLRSDASLFIKPPELLSQKLNKILAKTREIFTAWVEGELTKTGQKMQELLLMEPSLSYLHTLYAQTEALKTWMTNLSAGPEAGVSLTSFAAKLLETKPGIAAQLSQPGWLDSLSACAEALASATDMAAIRKLAEEKQWPIPWLDYAHNFIELPLPEQNDVTLDAEILKVLADFHNRLRQQQPVHEALEHIKVSLPAFHPHYLKLAHSFAQAFSSLPQDQIPLSLEGFPAQDREAVEDALDVLAYINSWKESITSAHPASHPAPSNIDDAWQVISEIAQTETLWKSQILPTLSGIKQKQWEKLAEKQPTDPTLRPLQSAASTLAALWQLWRQVPEWGLPVELSEEMLSLAEQAHAAYFKFWQEAEASASRAMQWLIKSNQPVLSGLNQNLLSIMRHLRTAARALEILTKPELSRTRTAQTSAGDLMFALVQLESLLQTPSRNPSKIRAWQEQYSAVLSQTDWQAMQQEISQVESLHPLLPWLDELSRRDVDYFSDTNQGQW